MMRVKIKSDTDDKDFLIENGFKFDVVYWGFRKDNRCIEIRGFEFEENELEILD
jgi:hypothetical protein